ncbi:MAG: hypothetical protein PHO00_07485 [bacterium]|nr:hypothetical protein [bacterium]
MKKGKRGLRTFCIFTLIFFIRGMGWATAEEVIFNKGFEDGEFEWYNWNDGESSGNIESSQFRSGSASACREIYGVGMGCYGQIISVNPGQTLEVSAWVNNPSSDVLTDSAEVFLRVEFWNDNEPLGSGHSESRHIKGVTEGWVKLDVSARVPRGATEARILAFNKGTKPSSRGKAYFDDFELIVSSGQ